jgi:hypothetical protein
VTAHFPDRAPARASWVVTLADLALLLVGFLLLVQATRPEQRAAVAESFRERFGNDAQPPPPLAVAAAGMSHFAPGSAALPTSPAALRAWAAEATRDARVSLTVTGGVDGTAADVDPATGSGAVLALDRARAVAAALGTGVPATRLLLRADARPRGRGVAVTQSFTGADPCVPSPSC